MFEKLRASFARWIAPSRPHSKRAYAGAIVNRLTTDWIAQSTSYDAELRTSLRTLRNRTRELIRDNDYAKNAVRVIKNNVVGTGIGFQAQVPMQRGGKLNDTVNAQIEQAWARWCRKQTCHTGGTLSFADIERLVLGAVPESGEILVRLVKQRFGGGRIPFALEIIESDQLVDEYNVAQLQNGNSIRMGVEVDQWNRPQAYWLYPRHPGDIAFSGPAPSNRFIRVPAEEVIHLFVAERPGATRGVPWFHSTLIRMNNMKGYEEAEIIAARASACIMGFLKSDYPDDAAIADGTDPGSGERVSSLAAGEIKELEPGQEFQGFAPARPNTGMDPFLRLMLRGAGAGIGVSYESLSRDYSQSNYSSSRLALLDDRDNWKVLQGWMIENFHQQVFERWLEMAVLSGELQLPNFELLPELYSTVRWMPRGWSWVDPFKEVQATKLAVRCGLKTLTQAVAELGGDIEDMMKQRRRELDLAAQYGLIFESDPAQVTDKGEVQTSAPIEESDTGTEDSPDAGNKALKLAA